MAYFPHNEIKSNWCMFGQEVAESLINKGFPRLALGFNSCRPHQNRAFFSEKSLKSARFLLSMVRLLKIVGLKFGTDNPAFQFVINEIYQSSAYTRYPSRFAPQRGLLRSLSSACLHRFLAYTS